MARVLVMVGTQKGAFFLRSDAERRDWTIQGPLLKGWEVCHIELDARREPVLYAGLGHGVYGPGILVSRDMGQNWTPLENGPVYAEGSGRKLERVWSVTPGPADEPDVLYAGVAQAGLFVSRDLGQSWQPLDGLNQHPTASEWTPGAGGLCCHTILIDPGNKRRLWVGISAVGVFRSDDEGATWEVKNRGLPIAVKAKEHEGIGSCVHKMVLDPKNPDLLYQQNHQGVFRSTDAGDSWQRIESGLPSRFGFPMVMHPRDSRTLYVAPMESDEYRFPEDGRLRVYRTRDGGDSWQPLSAGLPEDSSYAGVLRHAMATDGLDEAGIYFGTTGGQVFYSRDNGDRWQALPYVLPRVMSVTATTVE